MHCWCPPPCTARAGCSWKEAPVGLCSWTGNITQWFRYRLSCSWASLVSHTVKHLPEVQETWVWSLSQEDPLEEEMATHPVFLPGKSRGQRSLAIVHGVMKSWTWLSDLVFFFFWVLFVFRFKCERNLRPFLVFLSQHCHIPLRQSDRNCLDRPTPSALPAPQPELLGPPVWAVPATSWRCFLLPACAWPSLVVRVVKPNEITCLALNSPLNFHGNRMEQLRRPCRVWPRLTLASCPSTLPVQPSFWLAPGSSSFLSWALLLTPVSESPLRTLLSQFLMWLLTSQYSVLSSSVASLNNLLILPCLK